MGARIWGNRRIIKFSLDCRLEYFKRFNICCPEMATEIYAARCMLYDVFEKIDNGEEVRGASSMVKVFSSEVANRVADKAVQIFWGHGLMKGHPVEKMYRDIRMFRILMGTTEVQKR
ncbi:acyl-CoA dehydrogenase family protein [Peribacillus frigoritolerans]|uniref:acyl-CoA dehydrogenase family protein n=1 Tax=Peribacillus frigoritolerans TaxID=450367 RepID=UPI0021CFA9C7|nr:acyl-CoA dehydrogenase family protein [Peribacillus frigoritolerans]MCU6599445.1 acyl-CoA dehydrogenase family protein [Peribacillus frigoritolerans]